MKKIILFILSIFCLSGCVGNVNNSVDLSSSSIASMSSVADELSSPNVLSNPWNNYQSIDFILLGYEENVRFSNQVIKINNQKTLTDFLDTNHMDWSFDNSDDYFMQKSLIFIGFKHANHETNIEIQFIGEIIGVPKICLSYEEIGTQDSSFRTDIYILEVNQSDVVDWEIISLYIYNLNNGNNESMYYNRENSESGVEIDFILAKYIAGGSEFIGCNVCSFTNLVNSWDELDEYQKEENDETLFLLNSMIVIQFDYSQYIEKMEVLRLVKEQEKIIVVLSTTINEVMSDALSSHYFELLINKEELVDVNNIVFKFVNYDNSTWYDLNYTINI